MHGATSIRCGLGKILAVLIFCAAAATGGSAQDFLTISRPGNANSPLVEGFDGKLYGVIDGLSEYTSSCCTVFQIGVFGAFATLHEFCVSGSSTCPDGENPEIPMVLGQNGDFYGATLDGGANGYGTVFRITPAGKLTTLYNFCESVKVCSGGYYTVGQPVLGPDGSLYGANEYGGDHGYGTIFQINSQGEFTVIYRFCALSGCTDGATPDSLIMGTDGNLYGTTFSGGANHYPGTVFKLTPKGVLTTLHSFCARTTCVDDQTPDGQGPFELIQASDGNFYGTTSIGGQGQVQAPIIFKVTPEGTTTTVLSLPCGSTACAWPVSPIYRNLGTDDLIQGTDGNLYGVACIGPSTAPDQYGSLFRVTLDGALNVFYVLKKQDGACPRGLMQATNGKFYGTTGGESPVGTIFRLDMGLAPFVKTILTLGPVGAHVTIVGQDLAITTAVSFNGTPATFTACTCGSYLTTTVPTGATSGPVTVTTPTATYSSNVNFTVLP